MALPDRRTRALLGIPNVECDAYKAERTSAPFTPVNELRSLPSSTELPCCPVSVLIAQLIRRRVCFQVALSEQSELNMRWNSVVEVRP